MDPHSTHVFVKKETRVFKIVAKVWMMGNEDLDFTYLDGRMGREEGGPMGMGWIRILCRWLGLER